MENLIRLSSMTEAMRAKSILQKYRIFCKVQRISGKSSERGCSFGILIPNNFEKALAILADYNIYPVGRAWGDDL